MKKGLKLIFISLIMTVLFMPDVYGATYTYHYDLNGRLTYIESTEGRIYFQYDSNGNLLRKELKDPLGFGVLESPAVDQIYTNTLSIKGWHLDKAGIESIKVYLNNEFKGLATYGQSREDVYSKYPNYNNHNAGFYFDLVLPKENNNYDLKVVVRNNNGEEMTYTKSFKQVILEPIGEIETPQANSTVIYYINGGTNNNRMTITGWNLELVRMKKIEIYIDNYLVTPISTSINLYRNDIYNLHPLYANQYSGYSAIISTPQVWFGTESKELKIIIEDVDGQRTTYIETFTVKGSSNIIITDPCTTRCAS
ncbi:hypothetical protein [Paenibacillus caui]|uniref:hypothetical protein n=1 Tax=Paenibacillus caui TaxID=2873927 RepID=UPI001CA8BB4D|nr:hypothetical protein [Paenibacillus caui]